MKIFRAYSSAILVTLAMALIFSPTPCEWPECGPSFETFRRRRPGMPKTGSGFHQVSAATNATAAKGKARSMTGPRLGPDPVPFEVFTSYVRKPTGEMPPYTAKVVSDQELADIYAFLQTRPRPPAAKTIPLLK